MTRRVCITGLGVISSIGLDSADFWKNLLAGKSGIDRVKAFDSSNYEKQYAGEVRVFNANNFVAPKRVQHMGRSSHMAIAATKMALAHAKFNYKELRGKNVAVVMGTTMGESRILEYMDDMILDSPGITIPNIFPVNYSGNSITVNVAREFALNGRNHLFATACAAGNYALGYAYDLIKSGVTDCAIAGGVDSFSRVAFSGFNRLAAMASEECQPFDLNRQGMLVGEGAGVMLLEDLSVARRRGVNLYAEILGYGLSCDTHHMVSPDSSSIACSIRKALKFSNIKPEEVDYISAHGTGTVENDKAECEAYHQIFGHMQERIPMSSIKSMLGHTMGAASALESIACCLAIKYGEMPPTINFKNRDPFCDIDCVPNVSRKKTVNIALNNSQAFGGNNASLVLRKL